MHATPYTLAALWYGSKTDTTFVNEKPAIVLRPMPTSKVLNLHRRNTNNVGDLRCAPYLYFDELLGDHALEILGFRQADQPDKQLRLQFREVFSEAEVIVVGGGGLLEIDFFKPAFEFFRNNLDKSRQKLVLWGAGHNSWEVSDWRHIKERYSFDSDLFDLIGIRDAGHDYQWVPCASCMSEAFDKQYRTVREVGLYAHVGTMNNPAFKKHLPTEFDTLSNDASFEDAIDFLGSSELVITDSFHGAYWATLLGRKVVAFPNSSKFYDLMHAVPLCAPEDWYRFSLLSRTYPNALEECRLANTRYAKQVELIL